MRSWISHLPGAAALAIVTSVAGSAMAQNPSWAIGTWRGSIEGARNDPAGPDRILIIDAGSCRWDSPSKSSQAAPAKSCSFTADSVELLTGGSSMVKLKLTDGKLKGTLTYRGGAKPFFVTLSK
jgi:hypothetical protein